MIIFSILLLLLSNAVTLRKNKSILYSRVFTRFISLFHISIFLISTRILQLTAFYSRRVWTTAYSSLSKIFFYNLLCYRTKVANKMGEQFKIIEYPYISFSVGLLLAIFDLFMTIRSLFLEYMSIRRSIMFIVFIFSFDPLNLDFYTCIFILDNICLLYIIYVNNINPSFKYNYPKIHKWLDNICTVMYYINIILLLYSVFVNPTKGNSSSGSGSNGGPSKSNNPGEDPDPGKTPKGNKASPPKKKNKKEKRKRETPFYYPYEKVKEDLKKMEESKKRTEDMQKQIEELRRKRNAPIISPINPVTTNPATANSETNPISENPEPETVNTAPPSPAPSEDLYGISDDEVERIRGRNKRRKS